MSNLNLEALKKYLAEPLPRQILFFDEMLTPTLIQIVYWVALVAVVWAGLGEVFSGSLYGFIYGLVFIVLGCLAARVISELVMLLFQVHENLESIAVSSASTARAANAQAESSAATGNSAAKEAGATVRKKVTKKKASKKVTKRSAAKD